MRQTGKRPIGIRVRMLNEVEFQILKANHVYGILNNQFRGVGCIYYEMVTGRPMFPGQTVQDQLQLIFKKRGIPTEETWPEGVQNKTFQEFK